MKHEEYISERLDEQIRWYDCRSKANQKWFKRLRVVEIISASMIPFLAGLGDGIPYLLPIVGLLGVLIAICAGISTLNKYQENWLVYRSTAEALKHEKYLFITGSCPYSEDDSFSILVERVEGLISKENYQWARHIKDKKYDKSN